MPHLAIAAVASVCLAVGVIWFGMLIRDWWRELDALLAEDPMALWPDDDGGEPWRP